MGKATIQRLTLIFSGIVFLINVCTFSYQVLLLKGPQNDNQQERFQYKSGLHAEMTSPVLLVDLEEKEFEFDEKEKEEEAEIELILSSFIISGAQIFEFSASALYYKKERIPFHTSSLYILHENLRI